MTVQEQQMIDELVERIRGTQLAEKDVDAEQRLQQGLAGYPDAIYVLAQTVLVQKYGLEQAQQRLQAMQAELDQLRQQTPKSGGSFLSNLFGQHDAPQQPPPYQPVNNPGYPPQGYAQPGYSAQSYPPQTYPAAPYYAQPMGGGGGFLRSAMQTAAGVAMGEMVFEGVESLFHGFGGGGYGGGYGERPEVINNYYGEGAEHHAESRDDSSFYNPQNDASRDLEDRRIVGSGFADTDQSSDDSSGSDSDSGSDDFGSGDDGGSGGGDDSSF